MRTLTPRERVLIYIACMLGIVCFGFWIVKSTFYMKYSEAQEAAELARLELTLAESDRKTQNAMREGLRQQKVFYREYQDRIKPLLSDAAMEETILSMLEANGLIPDSSKISSAKPCRESEGTAFLYKGSVSIKTSGTIDNICGLLDQIASTSSMRTAAYSITLGTEINRLEIVIDIYMMDDSIVSSGILLR